MEHRFIAARESSMNTAWNGAAIKGMIKRLLCITGMCWRQRSILAKNW